MLMSQAFSLAQDESSQKNGWHSPRKVEVTSQSTQRSIETWGEAKSNGVELAWPSLETHERTLLTVRGRNVKFSQGFEDANAPYFNAIEQEFESGQYEFELRYFSNEIGKSSRERKSVLTDRKTLLQKRKELLEKGDRERAKRLLEQANQIRHDYKVREKAASPTVEEDTGSQSISFSKTGKFDVNDAGEITLFDPVADREKKIEQAKRARAESAKAQKSNPSPDDKPAQKYLP